jgi:hypothetical protein
MAVPALMQPLDPRVAGPVGGEHLGFRLAWTGEVHAMQHQLATPLRELRRRGDFLPSDLDTGAMAFTAEARA